jgi:hypothetical protein
MILKIKKRDLIILSIAIFSLLLVPITIAAVGSVKAVFSAELWITNNGPVLAMDVGRSVASADPTEGSTTRIFFVFNATDDNGEDDIDERGARFNLTLNSGVSGSAQWRYNSSCINISKEPGNDRVIFNCSVFMKYFDNQSSSWAINGTVNDSANTRVYNDTRSFTFNQLSAMSLAVAFINWTGVTVGSNDQAAASPLILNNTGNDDFDQINITAAALVGVTTSSETIAATLFAVNSTNAVAGKGLPLSTGAQVIPGVSHLSNLTLTHGHTDSIADYNNKYIGSKGNQSLYFWVDDPGAISAQKYNSTWNITVIDIG